MDIKHDNQRLSQEMAELRSQNYSQYQTYEIIGRMVSYHEDMAAPLLAEIERLREIVDNQSALIGQSVPNVTMWISSRARQERLPPDFETVLYDNLDQLYEKD